MLLAIDIGNSSTKFGLFEDARLTAKFAIKTDRGLNADNIFSLAGGKLPDRLSGIIISSVVKEVVDCFKDFSERYFGQPPIFIDATFDFGFSIQYAPPESCGVDRLVCAYAAVQRYRAPIIVCDFGTATTIDFVGKTGDYLGGIITPGPNTLGSALFEKTSNLPEVEFERPEKVIGDSTLSSIQSGIYFGYIGLVDGIIERMRKETESEPKIIATGGFAQVIAQESRYVETVDENLLLNGLSMLYENRESKK